MYGTPPSSQKAGVRPISFILKTAGGFSAPLTLKIRPEDLVRTEPSRIAVTQTLGRGVIGWADNFGEGLPSVTISGHTGWRAAGYSPEDGYRAFLALNDLVYHGYHGAVQGAADSGQDPGAAQLIFVDTLDGFTWVVAPMVFVLRRNRSRPLLLQYNITLQAISTSVGGGFSLNQPGSSFSAAKGRLGGLVGTIKSISGTIKGVVSQALAIKDQVLAPIAGPIAEFAATAAEVFAIVNDTVDTVKDGVSETANDLISMAGNVASVGVGTFHTLQNISSMPDHLKESIGSVSSAFRETQNIMENSLNPLKGYSDFSSLFSGSNGSSLVGPDGASLYANTNAFQLMQPQVKRIVFGSEAMSSISAIKNSDPVLAPMEFQELGRHLENINSGITFVEPGQVTA